MQKLHTSVFINAPVEKVWDTMLEDETYREWTKPFNDGSYFKGNWEEGSKIVFLGPNPEGEGEGGMLARIKTNRPHEFISIEHYGIVVNGVEDTDSEEVKKWTPAYENYTFASRGGGTEVSIEMDVDEQHVKMFEEMWPEALQELKKLAEK